MGWDIGKRPNRTRAVHRMTRQQYAALFAPLVLIPVMYAVFQSLAGAVGQKAAWYLGLAVY